MKGAKGELAGEFTPGYEEYEKCPKLIELIRATGERSTEIKSSSIRIDGEQSVGNLVLRFPFQECKPGDP